MSLLNILLALAPLVPTHATLDPLRKTCVAPNGDPLCSVEYTFESFSCPKKEESACKKDLCDQFSKKFADTSKKISVEQCAAAAHETGRRLQVSLQHDNTELDIKILVKGHVDDVENAVDGGIADLREVLNARWNYNDEADNGDDVQRARVDFQKTIITCNQDYCLNHGKSWKCKSTAPVLDAATATCDQDSAGSNNAALACKTVCCEQVTCNETNGTITGNECSADDGFVQDGSYTTKKCAYFDCLDASNHWKNDSECCNREKAPCSKYFRLNGDHDMVSSADTRAVCAAGSFVKMALCANDTCSAEIANGVDPDAATPSDCCVKFNGTGDEFKKVTEVAFKSNFDFEGNCNELFTKGFWDDVIVAIAAALDDKTNMDAHRRFTPADITLKNIPKCERRRLEASANKEKEIVFQVRSKSEAQLSSLRALSQASEKAALEEKLDAVLKQVGSTWSSKSWKP